MLAVPFIVTVPEAAVPVVALLPRLFQILVPMFHRATARLVRLVIPAFAQGLPQPTDTATGLVLLNLSIVQ